MKEQILKLIKERDYVTYAELDRHIKGFHAEPKDGLQLVWEHPKFRNMIFWTNISEEGQTAINDLLSEGKVHWVPASMLSYMTDGMLLDMPLVRRARAYKEPRWLPTCFRPGPVPKTKVTKRAA